MKAGGLSPVVHTSVEGRCWLGFRARAQSHLCDQMIRKLLLTRLGSVLFILDREAGVYGLVDYPTKMK
jgi:hypothetical protein